MLNRLSVKALLHAVIAALAGATVIALSLGARDSWSRLSAVDRIAGVADASAYMFKALHNLRVDRAGSIRDLKADKQFTAIGAQVRDVRAAEMPALKSALAALAAVDFPERASTAAALDQAVKRLVALHEETAAAFLQPKAARRPNIADDFEKAASALLDVLDKASTQLTRLVKLEDAFNDHLMEIKQLAWVARNAAGDASVMISNGLVGLPFPPDPFLAFSVNLGKAEVAWAAVRDIATGLNMPDAFKAARDKAERDYFAPDFIALRAKTIKALIAGEPPGITVETWVPLTIGKLAALLGVAEAALDVAKDHAAQQRSAALWKLGLQLGLLVAALVLATGMMLAVSWRVSGPLRRIQEAMLKIGGGDLSAEVSFPGRTDEIGALGNAMQVFRGSMIETERLRADQKLAETQAAAQRKAEMQRLANDFQTAIGHIVETVSSTSGELEGAAGMLTKTAEMTQRLSGVVASASEEASSNVQTVATAAEEMTSSVNEIARQVHDSSSIAAEAVAQAERTDARISELSNAASRIGDVVKLITAIAEQTNLLALNATIEAARAGEAGRGFAVVAQEVKALAAQTAKATDEIGTQISSMQSATRDSVAAIKEISGTIGRIAEIAQAIAAAVEQQGAATQEISRNVHQAARGASEVATNITDVNRGASETGTASSQVLVSAQSLSRESGQLKLEVEKFVTMVRAA